jgi:hypothetical protein
MNISWFAQSRNVFAGELVCTSVAVPAATSTKRLVIKDAIAGILFDIFVAMLTTLSHSEP